MKTSHTPGPWIAKMNGAICSDPATHGEHYRTIAHLSESGFIDSPEKAANARLIAAAPDLLDALQSMLTAFSLDNIGIESSMARLQAKHAARAAIARATCAA